MKKVTSKSFPYFLQVGEALTNRGYKHDGDNAIYRLWTVGTSLKLYDFFNPKRKQSVNIFLDAAFYELKTVLLTLGGVSAVGGRVHTYQAFKAFSIKHSLKAVNPQVIEEEEFKYECWKFRFHSEDACNNFLAVCEAFDDRGISAARVKVLQFEQIKLPNTTKSVTAISRVGQPKFRADLIRYWKTCAVTGLDVEILLRASHIKPWSVASPVERLDPYNGLLLSPNLDALFDVGLISFNSDGWLLVSPLIKKSQHLALGISVSMKLIRLNGAHIPYLAHHRKNVFKV